MAEFHARRFAAVFAANAELDVGRVLAPFDGDLHQLADAFLVDGGKRILLDDFILQVGRRKLPESSRLMPSVVCVRSLVPKLKNSASFAISSAVSAARGISIMVPTR